MVGLPVVRRFGAVVAAAVLLCLGGPVPFVGATGGPWNVTSSPSPGSTGSVLQDVSCVAATDCIAVGTSADGALVTTLVQRWNGSTIVRSADPTPPPSPVVAPAYAG